jgi:hypothetical protein
MSRDQQDNPCDENLRNALNITKELMELANRGDACRNDVGCGILFGMIRDCAYKIRSLADAEIAEHEKRAKWLGQSAKISQPSRE